MSLATKWQASCPRPKLQRKTGGPGRSLCPSFGRKPTGEVLAEITNTDAQPVALSAGEPERGNQLLLTLGSSDAERGEEQLQDRPRVVAETAVALAQVSGGEPW